MVQHLILPIHARVRKSLLVGVYTHIYTNVCLSALMFVFAVTANKSHACARRPAIHSKKKTALEKDTLNFPQKIYKINIYKYKFLIL